MLSADALLTAAPNFLLQAVAILTDHIPRGSHAVWLVDGIRAVYPAFGKVRTFESGGAAARFPKLTLFKISV